MIMGLILYVVFAVLVGLWANYTKNNGWAWGIAALLVSPLWASVALIAWLWYKEYQVKTPQ